MNKEEISIVVLLFLLLLGWGFWQHQNVKPQSQPLAPVPESSVDTALPVVPDDGGLDAASTADGQGEPSLTKPADPALPAAEGADEATPRERQPEQTLVLSTDEASVSISSWGGAVRAVEMRQYPATLDEGAGPVILDFSARKALSLEGVPGLTAEDDFHLAEGPDEATAVITVTLDSGIRLERTISVTNGYRLMVTDAFSNPGSEPRSLPAMGMAIGPMGMIHSEARTPGLTFLELTSLPSEGGDGIMRWTHSGMLSKSPLIKQFSLGKSGSGDMPRSVEHRAGRAMDWVAAENKFFVQSFAPEGGASDCELRAERDTEVPKGVTLAVVSAAMLFPGRTLAPGETFTRECNYYVGPKSYTLLKGLGNHRDEVMLRAWRGWGWFRWLSVGLLWTLNALYGFIPNYGVAIILLTVIVRVLLWPVTHKSTQSMKEMQKIQPLVAELRVKYKDKPQKMNQEVMALYREHKVNPMAGCLPMVMQMPIFIALFNVLRSAVELRFAGFLWVPDLSEPEGLLAGMIPIAGSLNILPILMTATMIWQQKLTPTGGDAQQQKMMMIFMPVFMLFIMYKMPSALCLYWTTSQCISIIQLIHQRRTGDRQSQVAPGSGEATVRPVVAASRPAGRGRSNGRRGR